MRDHRMMLAVLIAGPAVLSTGALAQTMPQPGEGLQPSATTAQQAHVRESSSAEPATQIEDIIVQARRSDESQQDVPVAVSTVTAQRLAEAVVGSVADIQRLVPSLQVTQGSTGQLDFTIRGAFSGFGVDPSVITYIDDVPVDPRSLVYSLFDLKSVQQLKGPQGTLFGRNSTGGAVLFTSARPGFSGPGGYLTGRIGNLDQQRFEGAVNLLLTDKLALRLSGERDRRDGTLRSVTQPGLQYDDRHNEALRASLLWTPSDTIENYTQATHYRVREHRTPNVATSLAGPCTGPVTPVASCLYQPPFNAFLGTDNLRAFVDQQLELGGNLTVNNDPNSDNVDRDSVTNTLTVDLGRVSVRNTSYYGETEIFLSKDYDGTPAQVIDANQIEQAKSIYSETQIYGRLFDDRLDWRIGAVYSRDDTQSSGFQRVFPLPGSLVTPRVTDSDTTFKSTALFGQVTYDLSDVIRGLSVTAGYRYTWDDRDIVTRAFSGMPTSVCALQVLPVPGSGPVAYPNTDLVSCTRSLSAKYEDDNYNLTLSWKPTERILLYAATRKGYKTGSFNTLAIDPALAQYQPEVVKDVEVGFKTDWTLGSIPFRTNVAAFTSDYDNIQTSLTVVDPVSGSVTAVTLNQDQVTGLSSTATIRGFEVELTVLPIRGVELSAFYSKVGAKYDRFFSVAPRLSLAGDNVGGVIPETFGATARIDVPIAGPFDAFDVTAGYYWRAAGLSNASTDLRSPPGQSYDSIDLRMALTNLFNSGADISVYGKNLGDSRDCASNNIVYGELTERCSEPRTYGLELSYRFGAERR